MTKLIIIGGAAVGTVALTTGITVPIVIANQGKDNNNNNQQTESSNAEKIKELKDKFEKGLIEANSKITDSTKFVEYYQALQRELNKEQTINKIKYVLSEVKVEDTTNIAKNSKIAIKYDFTLGSTKDSLTFEFKNPKPSTDTDTDDVQQNVQKIKELKDKFEKGLIEANSKINNSTKFVEYYNALKSELNKTNTSTSGVTYILSEVKVADESNIAGNDNIIIKYDFTLGSTKDSLTFVFMNVKETINDKDKVELLKSRLFAELTKLSESSNDFMSTYDSLNSKIDQEEKNELLGVSYKLEDISAQYPGAQKITVNTYVDLKYKLWLNNHSDTFTFRFKNTKPEIHYRWLADLDSNDLVVQNGILVKDKRVDRYINIENLSIPEYIQTDEPEKSTGIIYRAEIKGIGDGVYRNAYLKSVRFSSKIKSIGKEAFKGNNISVLDLKPTKIEEIGDRAFEDCSIYTLHLPNSLKTLGESTFANNRIIDLDLSSVQVKVISKGAFKNNYIKLLKLNKDVTTTIEDYAFNTNDLNIQDLNNSNLGQSKITKIGLFAFAHQRKDYQFNESGELGTPSAEKIIILPPQLEVIGRGAFEIRRTISYADKLQYDRHNVMRSPIFKLGSDIWDYGRKIKVVNEDGSFKSFAGAYLHFTSRALFNASMTNWTQSKGFINSISF